MFRLKNIFQAKNPLVIGMIHVQALPGTPNCDLNVSAIVEKAREEAEIYKYCKVPSVIIENMHDIPYVQSNMIGPEVIATMTRICTEIRELLPTTMSCGVQILAGGNKEALAVAQASGLQYIRAEGFIYSHIADEGLMNSCAGELLRYRRNIGAEGIKIFTDIKKKHCSHSITNDVSLEETAKAAEFFLSNGVIITGKTTGDPTDAGDVVKVKKSCSIPVLVGSGVTANNVQNYLHADGIIIGSHFKKDGDWRNEVDKERVQKFMSALEEKIQEKSDKI